MKVFFLYPRHRCELKCKQSGMLDKIEETLISLHAGLPGSSAQAASGIEVHTLQSIKKVIGKRDRSHACSCSDKKYLYFIKQYVAPAGYLTPLHLQIHHRYEKNILASI